MPRAERFTFLCSPNERKLIAELAKRMHRSQSDAVRFVVFEAAQREVINIIPDSENTWQEKSVSESLELIIAAIKKSGHALETDSSLSDKVRSIKSTLTSIKDELDQTAN